MLKMRQAINDSVKNIVAIASADDALAGHILTTRRRLRNYDCYYAAVEEYSKKCFNIPKVWRYLLVTLSNRLEEFLY